MSASPFTSSTALFGTPETEQQQQQGAPSPGSVEPNVLPLHQGGVAQPQSGANADLEYQRQLLAKKLSEKSTNFASPTDQMMSPCSKLLQAHKNKKFGKVNKPKLLSQAFSQAAKEKENRDSNAPIF